MDEWVEQETRHGIRYEKDDVECDASGDEEEGKEHCLLKGSLVRVGHETKCLEYAYHWAFSSHRSAGRNLRRSRPAAGSHRRSHL